MKTYEDLLNVGESDIARAKFCHNAVEEFKASAEYRNAMEADRYYHYHNVTIESFIKWIYTTTGRRVEDIYSANWHLKSGFFHRGVVQHANYLLGKGVILDDPDKKQRLGKTFDHELIKLVKLAMVESVSFGFWNYDHLEAFGYCCTANHAGFCPLYSEDTGELMAGVRFRYKKVKNTTICLYTLYEPDGITQYRKNGSEECVIADGKRAYKTRVVSNAAEGVVYSEDSNYNGILPIIPMYASDTYESDLAIVRDKIDCYDLIESGLANSIDDTSEIYWIIKNAGGMNDPSIARFLHRLKTIKGAAVDSEDGGGVEPHAIQVPHDARDSLLDRLRADIHEDWMLADRKFLSAAQKTEQEIEMAYQAQDDYTDDLEFYVMEFMDTVLMLAGIDSDVHFIRNKAGNKTEQTNMVLASANYVSPECVIRHLAFLTPEEMDAECEKLAKENIDRFRDNEEDQDEGQEDEEDEPGE